MGTAVLIVEDEALIAVHLQSLIEQAGYRVLDIAGDPRQALDCARANRPDFVLMDVRLARGTSGIDAAQALYGELGLRCVFVSGNIDSQMRRQTQSLRPLGYLGKPFMPQEVLAVIECAVRELNGCET